MVDPTDFGTDIEFYEDHDREMSTPVLTLTLAAVLETWGGTLPRADVEYLTTELRAGRTVRIAGDNGRLHRLRMSRVMR